jgi:uncharacterized protein involved in exopolysaccharide biosynthesis
LIYDKKIKAAEELSELRRRKRVIRQKKLHNRKKSSISDKTKGQIYSNDESADNKDKSDENKKMEIRSANRFKEL